MTQSTCWTMIDAAANGQESARDEFARQYLGPVRAYLAARWRGLPFLEHLDDAVQEVFFDLFRSGGVLDRVDRNREGGFRAFLYGVVRVAARAVERRNRSLPLTGDMELDHVPSDESSLSVVFDQAWATSIMHEAARRQRERSESLGDGALRRVELLEMRFEQDLPIREIARQWDMDPSALHREYAKARQEFKTVLLEILAFYHPHSTARMDQEISYLRTLLK